MLTGVRHLPVLAFVFAQLIPTSAFAQSSADSANLDVKKALERAKSYETSGDIKEATRYLNVAALQVWEEKNYPEAIRYFNESIELNKRINNQSGISKINSNLGMIYSDMRDFPASLDHFERSLEYRLKHGEKTEIISTHINKGVVLNILAKHLEAAAEIEKALSLATEMSDPVQMKSCYGILAETYEKAGNNERTMHYFNLYRTFHEMIQRDKETIVKKEIESAKLEALKTALETKEQELKLYVAERELAEVERELKFMNHEVDSLLAGNTKQELAMGLLEREVELKEMKVNETQHINKLQKVWIFVGSIATVIGVLFTFMLYRNNRYRRKTNNLLASQNDEIRNLNGDLEVKVERRTNQLQTTLVNLEMRNQDLDQFSHVISHNLRGPVASILGLGKIFNEEDAADPINADILKRLVISTQKLDDVVKELGSILEVKDKHSLPKQLVSVEAALTSAKDLLRAEIGSSGRKNYNQL